MPELRAQDNTRHVVSVHQACPSLKSVKAVPRRDGANLAHTYLNLLGDNYDHTVPNAASQPIKVRLPGGQQGYTNRRSG